MQAPLHRQSTGIAVMAPVPAAVYATTATPRCCGTAAGLVVVQVVAQLLGARRPAPPVPTRSATRHAVVSALACATATAVTLTWHIDHGYWSILTLAVVLRPVRRETNRAVRDRVLGTLAGVALAIIAVVAFPVNVAVVLAAGCLMLALEPWATLGATRPQTLFSTPVVILAGSSGLLGSTGQPGRPATPAYPGRRGPRRRTRRRTALPRPTRPPDRACNIDG